MLCTGQSIGQKCFFSPYYSVLIPQKSYFPNQASGALSFEKKLILDKTHTKHNTGALMAAVSPWALPQHSLESLAISTAPKWIGYSSVQSLSRCFKPFSASDRWLLGCKIDRLASVQEHSDYSVKNLVSPGLSNTHRYISENVSIHLS